MTVESLRGAIQITHQTKTIINIEVVVLNLPRLTSSSDHRRAVRPKLRQKASTTHLKILHQRKDVTSEIVTQEDEEEEKLDPNAYSTYMGTYMHTYIHVFL